MRYLADHPILDRGLIAGFRRGHINRNPNPNRPEKPKPKTEPKLKKNSNGFTIQPVRIPVPNWLYLILEPITRSTRIYVYIYITNPKLTSSIPIHFSVFSFFNVYVQYILKLILRLYESLYFAILIYVWLQERFAICFLFALYTCTSSNIHYYPGLISVWFWCLFDFYLWIDGFFTIFYSR